MLIKIALCDLHSFSKYICHSFAHIKKEDIPKSSLHSEFKSFESLLTQTHQSLCSLTQDHLCVIKNVDDAGLKKQCSPVVSRVSFQDTGTYI